MTIRSVNIIRGIWCCIGHTKNFEHIYNHFFYSHSQYYSIWKLLWAFKQCYKWRKYIHSKFRGPKADGVLRRKPTNLKHDNSIVVNQNHKLMHNTLIGCLMPGASTGCLLVYAQRVKVSSLLHGVSYLLCCRDFSEYASAFQTAKRWV